MIRSIGNTVDRVQVVPQADDQISFQVDGVERARWHFARRYPRPHLFPIIGPSGRSVTRMGHPAAPDHDHHRSVWFAHRDVGGVNFWEDRGGAQQIRQDQWVHYQDSNDEALAALRLGWYDSHSVRLMQQELVIVFRPLEAGESWFELQSTFTSPIEALPIGKSNFGFLAVRVAKSISARFGGGRLRNSEAKVGEQEIFGGPARWMDYSGPVIADLWEGITYFDHPTNPNQPTHWHVRDDGWMAASVTMNSSLTLMKGKSLVLRYALLVHRHDVSPDRAQSSWRAFAESRPFEATKEAGPYTVAYRR